MYNAFTYKEKIMYNFDIETAIKPAVTGAKLFTGMVPNESMRKAMEAVIDANAAFTVAAFDVLQSFPKTLEKSK
jgi:hypothetical protein